MRIHCLVYTPDGYQMRFAYCVYWPWGTWNGAATSGKCAKESLLWLERNPVEGRSLQAIVSREICCCEKEKLPRLVMTKVKADARKSRQPLNPKIKSGRASLLLHKMWRDWTLSIYINEVKFESWIKVMGNNWKSLRLETPRQSVLKKEAEIFGVI